MRLDRRMGERRQHDQRLEATLRIRKHDPQVDTTGGIRYSRADIEALEEERLPWLRMKRRAARRS